jgi:hypothetical protein
LYANLGIKDDNLKKLNGCTFFKKNYCKINDFTAIK